jgi:6-phosphogluconolactonase
MEKRITICCVVGLIMSFGAVPGIVMATPEGNGEPERGGPMSESTRTLKAEGEVGADSVIMYVGTYTPKGEGIYVFSFDPKTGGFAEVETVTGLQNPSFVALHPTGRFLYTVNEVRDFEGQKSGAVTGFSVDQSSGKLKQLNQKSSGGMGPCFVSVAHDGKHILVANYGSGSVAVLSLDEDGLLGKMTGFAQHEGSSIDPRRQASPHAHSIKPDPANRYALAADLGLDKILVYKYDADSGSLTPNQVPWVESVPGSGPRHIAFRPDGRYLYVADELTSAVSVFRFEASDGTLQPSQTVSMLPEGFEEGNSAAEILVHPSGKAVYASNRGHDSIVVFSADPETGRLSPIQHASTRGDSPRNFGIDPTGQYLIAANQRSDNIVVFKIDAETGGLEFTGRELSVPSPVCVRFLTLPSLENGVN